MENDTVIGDSFLLATSYCIGASVRVANNAFVGLNSTVREGVSIGEFGFVGMGANVLADVQPDTVVFGNPAKARE